MFGTFGGVVVTADHVVVMKGASWTSKRFGADVSHLKASWDLLGDGESVDHVVVRNVGICIMATDTWCSIDGIDDLDDWLIVFHNGDRADDWAAEDGLERSEDFYGRLSPGIVDATKLLGTWGDEAAFSTGAK